ncbi:hypothetical protein CC80DRAFT_586114, partial [Byssothecium circinans]
DLVLACPLTNYHASIAPQYDIGTLDALALELIQSVLVQLDISSLMNFRRVNPRALQVVDDLPQYREISSRMRLTSSVEFSALKPADG